MVNATGEMNRFLEDGFMGFQEAIDFDMNLKVSKDFYNVSVFFYSEQIILFKLQIQQL